MKKTSLAYFSDKAGRKTCRGDLIVYGHNVGRCGGLRFGIIKDINKGFSFYGNREEFSIRVRGIDDDWEGRPAKLCSVDGTLMYPDRCLLVTEDVVPEDYNKLLRDHYLSFVEEHVELPEIKPNIFIDPIEG